MRIPDKSTLTIQVTNWKAAFAAGLLIVSGLIVSALSKGIATEWIEAAILGLGTTLVSLGALSLLFELFLRRNVTLEMIRLVNIQQSVIEGQLAAVGRSRSVQWSAILGDRSDYAAILMDPSGWIEQNFHFLLASAARRKTTARLFLPDPDSDYCVEIAASIGKDPVAFQTACRDAALSATRLWTEESKRNKLTEGSRLTIRWLHGRPMYTLVTGDAVSVVIITGALGREGADPDHAYIYNGDPESYPSQWFREQINSQEHANIHFENEIKSKEAAA